jgi:hypothetical protein
MAKDDPGMIRNLVCAIIFVLSCVYTVAQTEGAASAPSDSAVGTQPGKAAPPVNGGVQILSDTEGVDFAPYLKQWHTITQQSWLKLMPPEVNAPTHAKGVDAIRFKILPNGRLMDRSVVLEGRSGDVALDRAAWDAIVRSHYPPLPSDFHGPYIELRTYFLYNMQPQ